MKILFLDIDGVANSSRSVIVKMGPTVQTSELVRDLSNLDRQDHDMIDETGLSYGARFGLHTADPVCVALINKLFESGTVGLVLSSSHRRFFCHSKIAFGSDEHLRRLRLYLTAMGFKVPEFFSVTNNRHCKRGEQIDDWLNLGYENGIIDDGEQYVILDDSSDMLPGQSFVHIDPTHGISFDDYAEACKHLGLEEPGLILL